MKGGLATGENTLTINKSKLFAFDHIGSLVFLPMFLVSRGAGLAARYRHQAATSLEPWCRPGSASTTRAVVFVATVFA